MSAVVTCESTMAKKKKTPQPESHTGRERIDLRADAEWIARIQRQADRNKISLSAFIRLAISQFLQQYEANDPELKGK